MNATSPPHFVDLVRACRPGVLFGEQVASAEVFGKAAKPSRRNSAEPPQWAWIDDLSDRLEAARYAVGANDFPSAGIGAPHIRQRTFFGAVSEEWLADSDDARLEGRGKSERGCAAERTAGPGGLACGLADANGWDACAERQQPGGEHGQQPHDGGAGGMADAHGRQRHWIADGEGCERDGSAAGWLEGDGQLAACGEPRRPGPTNGFWGTADWLLCRDERWRPVEPGTFPLAHGVSGRVGLLRGYGNAINPHAAAEFIAAFSEAAGLRHLRVTALYEMTTDERDIFG